MVKFNLVWFLDAYNPIMSFFAALARFLLFLCEAYKFIVYSHSRLCRDKVLVIFVFVASFVINLRACTSKSIGGENNGLIRTRLTMVTERANPSSSMNVCWKADDSIIISQYTRG